MNARDKCPAHYSFSDLQPWDVIDAWGLDYYLGNVLKYICRAGRKSPERLVDLNKALHYLQKEVELAERELAESCAFTSPRKTTEDTVEDTSPENITLWPEIACRECHKEMEPIVYDSENEEILYFCSACEKAVFVRLDND